MMEDDGPEGAVRFSETVGALSRSVSDPVEASGYVWDVTVIRAGESKNAVKVGDTVRRMRYPREALIANLRAFEGARVYANTESDQFGHKKDSSKKTIRDVVGFLENVRFENDEIRATLKLLPSAAWLRDDLVFAETNKKLDVFQLSIDAGGVAHPKDEGPNKFLDMERFDQVDVDVVPRGAAGGKFNRRMLESLLNKGVNIMNARRMLEALFAALYPLQFVAIADLSKVDENELYTKLREADKASPRLNLPEGFSDANVKAGFDKFQESIQKPVAPAKTPEAAKPEPAKADDDRILKMQASIDNMRRESCSQFLESRLATAKLPEASVKVIKAQFKETVDGKERVRLFTEAELSSAIKEMRDMLAALDPTGVDTSGLGIHAGADELDKFQASVDAFFLSSGQGLNPVRVGTDEYKKMFGDMKPIRSIREAYVHVTGDKEVSGLRRDMHRRFSESLETADWPEVLSTSMNKRLVRDYEALAMDNWRLIADVVPLSNFKQQDRVRFGGYGNLPIVAERAAYLPLTSPTDESAIYSPEKRGGTEDVSREMIKNDDVSAIQKLPTRMATSAKRTLYDFVFNFINPAVNAVIYDGVAIYHANHLNTGTAALGTDGVALAAARLRMRKYLELDSSKRLGVTPGWIIVPSDLEQIAYGLVTPAYNKSNNVPEFLQNVNIGVIVNPFWTDATDWVLGAFKSSVVGIEIGFIDGQELPQIFVSDLVNAGSMFTNDVLTYKIRHEYGGAVTDWRAFDGEIVAG